jgi:hypothetical protein
MYIVHEKQENEYHVFKELSRCAEYLGKSRLTLARYLKEGDVVDKGTYVLIKATSYQLKSNRGGYRSNAFQMHPY